MSRHPKSALCFALALVAGACTSEVEPALKQPERGAARGGTLVVGISEPRAIEPSDANSFDPAGSLVVRTMCDALLQFDPVTGAVRPAIAKSWEVAEGGRQVTVRLRKGVRFPNGRELTADDVVYSLSRVASGDYGSSVASLLEPVVGYGLVHGDEDGGDARFRTTLQGVRAITATTVQVTLSRPFADFVRVLGHPLASPIPKGAADSDPQGFAARPVCVGPYQLSAPWRTGDSAIRLRRVPSYFAGNTGYTRGGGGYADVVEFRVFADPQAQLAAFEAGELDVAHAMGPEPRAVLGVSATLEYIGLPTTREPFDRQAVRVALSRAIDRRRIADVVFGGGRAPATGLLPPSVGRARRPGGCGADAPETTDVAGARAMLAGAGVDLRGTRVPMYFNDEFANRAVAEGIAEGWRAALGLEVDLVPMGWEEYLDRGRRNGFDGPFRMGWAAQYPTADEYLYPLLHSKSIGQANLARFSDRTFDRLLERSARRAVDEGDRTLDYREAEGIACEQMPILPLVFGQTEHLVRTPGVGSAVPALIDRTTAEPILRELYLRDSP